jgi:DNA (cytosine-5)-methyltransferase 1
MGSLVEKLRVRPSSLELFTGAGGLALGTAQAGFSHQAVIEWNHNACETLRDNARRIPLMKDWEIREQDVKETDFRDFRGNIDLLAAGAPCQPFSLGGKHRAQADERNMFPELFRAVREIQPAAVLVENVKGLLRRNFRPYFDYIVAALSDPDLPQKPQELWENHFARLQKASSRRSHHRIKYRVMHQLLNAADYGLPQKRERVFIVAFRDDLDTLWPGISPTHSEDALLYDQWVSGTYWREHRVHRAEVPVRLRSRVDRLWAEGRPMLTDRWRTVRDALVGLPTPRDNEPHASILNHLGNPGARSYVGHTGSPIDEPAKTLKAGDHGVPGGENMLRYPNGKVRYFSVREAARLQGFPDDYVFRGPWTECLRQLGNAVPVGLARKVAESVRDVLENRNSRLRVVA